MGNTSFASLLNMEHENKDSKHDIDIVITEPEKGESYDETDAKLFSGKLFGDRHENKPDVIEEKQEEKVFEAKIEEDNFANVVVKPQDVYSSSGNRRGVCLVIENDMFHTSLGLSKRKGSLVDRQLMVQTFTRLHFEVRVYSNLTVKDINNMLEKVSLAMKESCMDMTIPILLIRSGNTLQLTGAQHWLASQNCSSFKHVKEAKWMME